MVDGSERRAFFLILKYNKIMKKLLLKIIRKVICNMAVNTPPHVKYSEVNKRVAVVLLEIDSLIDVV